MLDQIELPAHSPLPSQIHGVPRRYYACIIWRTTADKERQFKELIQKSDAFEIVFENHARLPKDRAAKIIFRMYDRHLRRPWQKQIALIEETNYYLAILGSTCFEKEDWVLTRGGITLGSRKLLTLKETYRASQEDSFMSLHTSINQEEAQRDIFTHTGINIKIEPERLFDLPPMPLPQIPGEYATEEEFFAAVKAYPKCCLILDTANACLASQDQEIWKRELILLVDDPINALRFFGIEKTEVIIGAEQRSIRLIGVYSKILCPVWANTILETRVYDSRGLPIPAPIHHFFSLVYFREFFGGGISKDIAAALSKILFREKIFGDQNFSNFSRNHFLRQLRKFILGSGFSIPAIVADKINNLQG